MSKYQVNSYTVDSILTFIKSGEIAIPEIQRPFVWDATKVRDLLDSLYQGYPVGYIIAWKNPNVRLKDGSMSEGKKILIDGQQRITALNAALLGQYVIDKNYQKTKIKIAFNPQTEKFEVQNPAIIKDKAWVTDVSIIIDGDLFDLVDNYIEENKGVDEKVIRKAIMQLRNILNSHIGLIELASDLDIETVTEIFIRINSKGMVLSQADFAMSKIAADTENNGNQLRKAIDYFCHLAKSPDFYQQIIDNDPEFAQSKFFSKMKWLKDENDDLYIPSYNDLLRVAFTAQFNRGKLADLVSLLSGRNFESRRYEKTIAEESFHKLSTGIKAFINETNYKRFLMIIKSAGFISPKLIRSQGALNFAYILYLKLKEKNVNAVQIEKYVKRWFVYSILTGRYSGSTESTFDLDIRQISEKEFGSYLTEKEEGELSEAFWLNVLPQNLENSVVNSPYFSLFLAAQVKNKDKGFLSKDILVSDLIELRGDIHHLFPKDYLKSKNFKRGEYNQIANYVYMQSEINIKIGNKSPQTYFELIRSQFNSQNTPISGIMSEEALLENLAAHCIPTKIIEMDFNHYPEFLIERRKLMALKIRDYYFSL